MNTRQIKKVIIPITAIVILLAMVAWLAGSFNDKIAPILQANNHLKSSVPRAEQFIVSYSEQLSYEPALKLNKPLLSPPDF